MTNKSTSTRLQHDVRYYYDGDLGILRWASPKVMLLHFHEEVAVGNRLLQYDSINLLDIFTSLEMIDALSVDSVKLKREAYKCDGFGSAKERVAFLKYDSSKSLIRLEAIRLMGLIRDYNKDITNYNDVVISCELLRSWLYLLSEPTISDKEMPHLTLNGEKLFFWVVANHQDCIDRSNLRSK